MWVKEGFVSSTHESVTMRQMFGSMKVLFQVIMK